MTKRREYTEHLIQDCLYQLLTTLPSEKITVTKLCEAADINRATFYQHYASIDDLYEKTVANFYMGIVAEAKALLEQSGSTYDTIRQIVTISLNRYASVPAYYPLLTHLNRDQLHRFIYSQYIPREQDTPRFRMQMDFIMSGGDGVCSQWMAKGCTTPINEIADMIASLIFKCFA